MKTRSAIRTGVLLHGGVLAIDPRALQALAFAEPPKVDRSNVSRGQAVVVRVQGPLEHHASEECDSYDAIVARVDEACAASEPHVVLAIDSPGGLVAGCFEAVKTIRARVSAAGKTLTAYVAGNACSAAYALACAAERIVAPESSLVGHVGVIDARIDVTAMDAAMGVQFAFITSGARKADGNPHAAFTAEELADRQRVVDTLAGVFFGVVADARKTTPGKVAALEARVFSGQAALAAGLIDSIATMDELLASLAAGAEEPMSESYEETARAALKKAAEGDDKEAAARARRALAAMDGDEDKKDDAEAASDEDAAAEGDGEPDGDEGKADKPAAAAAAAAGSTVSAQAAGDLAGLVAAQGRKLEALSAQLEAQQRSALLAARPDLPKDLRKLLATKPVAEVKAILSAMPKAAAANPAASATPAATRGATQGTGQASQLPPDQKAKLDERMGLSTSKLGAVNQGNKLILGALVPASGKDA